MKLQRIRSGPFCRIGNQYGHLIDNEHFMGRTAFDDLWMSKVKPKLKKRQEGFDLELPLPGFRKEEISLEIKDNHLVLNAERLEKDLDRLDRVSERLEERLLELSSDIDQERISAWLEDGMLRIRLPQKSTEERSTKTIEVK